MKIPVRRILLKLRHGYRTEKTAESVLTAGCQERREVRYVSVKKTLFIAILVVTAFFAFSIVIENKFYRTSKCNVIMYHLIDDDAPTEGEYLYVRPSEFDFQLSCIGKMGVETVFAEEINEPSAKRRVAITLDDGYKDNYTEMFPILKKYGMKATIFIISDYIGKDGYLNEEEIKEMSESGLVSFQSHTCSHTDMIECDEEELFHEFYDSKSEIERITGKRVTCLAYPRGVYGKREIEAAKACGYKMAFTTEKPNAFLSYESFRVPRNLAWRGMNTSQFLRIFGSCFS